MNKNPMHQVDCIEITITEKEIKELLVSAAEKQLWKTEQATDWKPILIASDGFGSKTIRFIRIGNKGFKEVEPLDF